MESEVTEASWWGEFSFDRDDGERWEVGSLNLWVHRAAAEWRLAYEWEGDEGREHWQRVRGVDFPDMTPGSERFAVRETGGVIYLRARTADRSVVARPKTPLRVPSGQQAKIFISSPLWVEISVGPGSTFLRELPTRRLSNTWFGPTTREGEIAYALKTGARTRAEELPPRPYRFTTPIVIENQASDTLEVERLNLPVPHLSLYDDHGTLWSQEVHLVRTESGDLAELDIQPGPPPEAPGAPGLGEPRQLAEGGHLFRAFSSILRLTETGS